MTRCRCRRISFALLLTVGAVFAAACGVPHRASAQVLVDSSNSAIGASSSAPDPAHFQNGESTTDRAVYVGYDASGPAYMDNTGDLSSNGTDDGPWDVTGNWGIGVGIFPGGEGYLINSGTGTVSSQSAIRIGDGFDADSYGEFHQQSSGSVTAESFLTVGNFGGTGKFVQSGTGAVNVNDELWIGVGSGSGGAVVSSGEYVVDNAAAQLSIDHLAFIGRGGATGTFSQQNGNVTLGTEGLEDAAIPELYLGFQDGSTGQYDLLDGSLTVYGWSNLGRDGGTAVFNNSGTFTTTRELRIGVDYSDAGGNGELNNLADGEIEAGDIFVGGGSFANASGLLQQTGAGSSITVAGWTYVGSDGTGTLNMDAGTFSAGENFSIGLNATGSGAVNMTGGTITVVGNTSPYTGNFLVGRNGNGTLDMSGGTIDLIVGDTGTNNSASYSAANATDPGAELDLAQDGNLAIAEEIGTGVADLSGDAVINVAANVFVGGAELDPNDDNYLRGGNGTLTIRDDAELHVGTTSPTGGDLVLGSSANVVASVATVNLEGGMLDVAHSYADGMGNTYGGNIASGGADTMVTFDFTGGTLKVREWNATGLFGGDLGNLVQNGPDSLLDVTDNNTTLHSDYDLGEGTATIASGRTLTASGVLNSAGAGVINVGTGGGEIPDGDFNEDGFVDAADYTTWRDTMSGNQAAYNTWKANFGASSGGGSATLTVGDGAIAVDTLNLNNGNVIAGGGVTIDTALTGSGAIDGDLTLDSGATLLIELGGATPVTEHDQIDVSGTLDAAGTLQVSLIDGFTPAINDSFDILDFGAFAGDFTSVVLPTGSWDTDQLTVTGVITYLGGGGGAAANVPEPATLSQVIGVFIILLTWRRGSREQ